ncbi:hypothetical protein QLS71_013425 [Mariniflexile litorale]|uniref:C1q domain-containing protein n=1 Tax=Mariniflexile litorale TaxID=3045158 RepID=A0AAU7ECE4_9FLAO|nr:hypothetical protein [Mariniflexile sp. KMM 9835]MDQ8212140.1 hypothetical protein [Mariniflexile sp. KMM 9835]
MMNKVIFLLFFTPTLGAQVGIETTNPTATLDVNGTLRIRSTINETDLDVINDSILVISKSGNVNRAKGEDIINATLPTMVRASFSTSGDILHTLIGDESVIEFDTEQIDYNSEFDPSTYTFTAKQEGIYNISAQIKINAAITASTNFGLGIYKNNVLVAEQSFLSVVVGAVDVSSPIRYVSATLDLAVSDTITFKVTSGLVSVNILGISSDSYCAIYQIR